LFDNKAIARDLMWGDAVDHEAMGKEQTKPAGVHVMGWDQTPRGEQ
jgi:hypothetical protein